MEISSHHNRWQWLNMLWPGEDTEREEGIATREGTGSRVGTDTGVGTTTREGTGTGVGARS